MLVGVTVRRAVFVSVLCFLCFLLSNISFVMWDFPFSFLLSLFFFWLCSCSLFFLFLSCGFVMAFHPFSPFVSEYEMAFPLFFIFVKNFVNDIFTPLSSLNFVNKFSSVFFHFVKKFCQQIFSSIFHLSRNFVNKFFFPFPFCREILSTIFLPFFHFVKKFCQQIFLPFFHFVKKFCQ